MIALWSSGRCRPDSARRMLHYSGCAQDPLCHGVSIASTLELQCSNEEETRWSDVPGPCGYAAQQCSTTRNWPRDQEFRTLCRPLLEERVEVRIARARFAVAGSNQARTGNMHGKHARGEFTVDTTCRLYTYPRQLADLTLTK